jgi:hypothetical protein
LKPDAKVFAEMIFDVNTAYFENHGGYDYAKSFFEEAYRCAVKEIGGEDYILSAVLHADERNRALSEELGRDVYHYHLHVVYVPVVQKEILWSKRTKDKSLIGKVKEVIPQISHSKKWPMRVPVECDGKTIMLNSYSLLQDRFFEHMRTAGFEGFERGERGSTPVKISRPFIGGSEADTATLSKKDWDNVKKTALTQAHKDEEYRAALSDVTTLKKEKKKWRNEKQGLEYKVEELENSTKQDFMERASRDSELHNLKNSVAKIPKDVWDMYTNPKAQQRITKGVR